MSRKVLRVLLILLFLLLSAYSKPQLKDISVQLKWKHNFEYVGFYMAIEKGYYKEAGLNVELKELDSNTKRDANYNVLRSASLIDISKGEDIVYLFAIYQSNPLVLLADKSSNIKTIKDIKNRKIMGTKTQLQDASLASLLAIEDIKEDEVEFVKPSFDVSDLLNGKTDLMIAFVSNEPFTLKELGGTPIIFDAKDYGFDFYNNIVSTTREYLLNNPDEVRKFKQATIKGYEYAFSRLGESIDLVYKKYNSLHKSKKALIYEANELKKLAYYKTEQLGTITKNRLEKSYYAYRLLGLIHDNIDINNIIYKDVKKDIKLTKKEKTYLQNKKDIKVCSDPNWLPFDKMDENGNYIGISADYLKLISKFLDTKMLHVKASSWAMALNLAKDRKCDIITSVSSTAERKKYLNFTTPYAKFPLVIATKIEIPFIDNLGDLSGKKVGIVPGSAFAKSIKNSIPSIKIIDIKNISDGLEKVSNGAIFALIDTLPSIAFELQAKRYQNIKISGKAYGDWEISMGVRNDDEILLDVLQKAINSVTMAQNRSILNNWISVKYESSTNYSLAIKVAIVFIILTILMVLWLKKLNSLNNRLQLANKKIDEKNRILDTLATTDKLTNIYNRLKLDDILENELDRNKRYQNGLGVCILDIDNFKVINDTYGHQIGDQILVKIAQILKLNTRKTDFVGRWGGEEFLIICLAVDEENLYKLIEKIRQDIKNYKFPKTKILTASFGITIYQENDSLKTITKRADDALYEAKNKGRDRVVIG